MRPRHSLNPSYQSKWGHLWNLFIPNQMATFVTDKTRNLLLLKSDFLSDYWDCKFYSLPWATTESLQLLFDNLSTPLTVETNQEFEIWFSEDLFKWGYGDNIMGTKKRVLQCMVCTFAKCESTLKKRVP